MLHEFITSHRDEIVARVRAQITQRRVPAPTDVELQHVPTFLDQLVARLRAPADNGAAPAMRASASVYGRELLKVGLTVGQVVHDYGNICQSINQLAIESRRQISPEDNLRLNQCLDDVTADAVSEYGRQRERAIVGQGVQQLGSLVHEMRNVLSTAMLAFEALHAGALGVVGKTGLLLGRSLQRMRDLIDRSLAEARLEVGSATREHVVVAELLEELAISAMPEAAARNVEVVVTPVAVDVALETDHSILTSVISNLVQNACKFTPPQGHVILRTTATSERVTFEVQDECGGLPPGKAEELFQPFQQRGADRSGLGLGLAIVQKGVHALGGEVHVHDLPGTGCVFTVELPRSSVGV